MVMLLEADVLTKEVLDWQGINLLHFMGSSCSQKTRIFLGIKGIAWTSHHVDLSKQENASQWFMGINPRGLVPVLVDDGQVIIESNDILEYLEAKFPEPALIPEGQDVQVSALLEEEDDLHLDLRAISMRYLFGVNRSPRGDADLKAYQARGSGTVGGTPDPEKDKQIQFFKDMAANNGISDAQVKSAAGRFHTVFSRLDQHLSDQPYLMGDALSVVDIAWYIYAARLLAASYPLHRLHVNFGVWFDGLHAQPHFAQEVALPPPLKAAAEAMHAEQDAQGTSLAQVAGL